MASLTVGSHFCSLRLRTLKSQHHRQWCSTFASNAKRSGAQRAAYDFYHRKANDSVLQRLRQLIGLPTLSPKKRSVHLSRDDKNIQVAWYVTALVIGAVGATYAAVPLYKVFCQRTGFGGATRPCHPKAQRVIIPSGVDDGTIPPRVDGGAKGLIERMLLSTMDKLAVSSARVHTWTDEDAAKRLLTLKPVANADLLTVRFDTTVGDILPWSFVPLQLDVKVVPGETALSFFRVTNKSNKAITGVATYNVHPPKVGLYFQKIQCFCFEEQRLLPGETVDMPVFFFIDPEFLNDPQVSYVRSITLSYTFFKTCEDDDEDEK